MTTSMWERCERCALLLMFVTTLGLSGTVFYDRLTAHDGSDTSGPRSTRRRTIAPGEQLRLWSEHGGTGVAGMALFLSSTCTYCAANGPLYEHLSAAYKQSGRRLIAVFSPSDVNAEGFLREHRIRVDKLVRLDGVGVPVSGVPTMVAVRSDGTVQQVWKGAFRATEQAQVLKTITSPTY